MIFNSILLERAYLKTKKDTPPHPGAKMRQRRRNALNKAYEFLQTNPYIDYENGKLLLLSDSKTETGAPKYYETTRDECRLTDPGKFLCHAFWEGNPCYHRAVFEIVENYFEIVKALDSEKTIKSVSIVNNSSPS